MDTDSRLFCKVLAILFLAWLFLFLFNSRYFYYQDGTMRINRLTSKLFILDSESAEWRDIRKQHREKEKKLADEQVEYKVLLKRLRSLMTPDEIKSMEDQGLSEDSWLMKTKREKEPTEKSPIFLIRKKTSVG